MSKWEKVTSDYPFVNRFPVPGGWLYRTDDEITFVPEPMPEVTIIQSIGQVSESLTGPADLLKEWASARDATKKMWDSSEGLLAGMLEPTKQELTEVPLG